MIKRACTIIIIVCIIGLHVTIRLLTQVLFGSADYIRLHARFSKVKRYDAALGLSEGKLHTHARRKVVFTMINCDATFYRSRDNRSRETVLAITIQQFYEHLLLRGQENERNDAQLAAESQKTVGTTIARK